VTGDLKSSEAEHRGSVKGTGQMLQDETMGVRSKMVMKYLSFARTLNGGSTRLKLKIGVIELITPFNREF
jgi:hypothetical protein